MTIAVRCPIRPGLIRVGPYVPGQVYDLPDEEAERLIAAKGFVPAGTATTTDTDTEE